MELISIIVPVYNAEKYIVECLLSIKTQTYKNIEILLIDDGSKDNSIEKCKSIIEGDERIKVFCKDNKGQASARNYGIRQATGKYIMFCDSDDILAPTYVELLYNAVNREKSDLACCETVKFLDNDNNKLKKLWTKEYLYNEKYRSYEGKELIPDSLYEKIRITEPVGKIYKTSLFEKVMFPEGLIFEDLATTYKVLLLSDKVTIIEPKLYGYRKRVGSTLNSPFSNKCYSAIWVSKQMLEDLKDDAYCYNAACCAAFRVNRLVYYRINWRDIDNKKMIWNQICNYRKAVVHDGRAKKYERALAILSYLGRDAFLYIVRFYEKMKIVYYMFQR